MDHRSQYCAECVAILSIHTAQPTERGASSDPTGQCLPSACAGPTYYLIAPGLSIFGQGVPKGAILTAEGIIVRTRTFVPPTLQLVAMPPSNLITFLRQIPVVQRWLPRPQPIHFLRMAVYRVRLQFNGPTFGDLDCQACGPVGILL